jgi:uncharacterized damage-inducible protein DinB
MSGTVESFRAVIFESPQLLERWNQVSTKLIADAKSKGVTITAENLMSISGIRIHVLTGDDSFLADWESQAKQSLPEWQKIERERELISAIANRESDKHQSSVAHLESMPPEERMKYARSNQLSAPAVKEKIEHTPERRVELIEQASKMRGGAKIAFAREHGLD